MTENRERALDRCRRQVMSLQEAEVFAAEVSALRDVAEAARDVLDLDSRWGNSTLSAALDRLEEVRRG